MSAFVTFGIANQAQAYGPFSIEMAKKSKSKSKGHAQNRWTSNRTHAGDIDWIYVQPRQKVIHPKYSEHFGLCSGTQNGYLPFKFFG